MLAPLPAAVEPADTASFRRQIAKDMWANWHPAWLRMVAAQHYLDGARHTRVAARLYGNLTPDIHVEEISRETAYLCAVHDLMLTPAARKTDLKWKLSTRKFDGGRPQWERQIELDEARLNGGEA